MKPFRERNPVVVGAMSIAALALLLVAAMRAQDLPLIGGGDTYYASFSEAGGLKIGDEVRIAGVRVGQVDSMELDGNSVKVGFQVKTDAELGEQTGADIRVKTILGSMYLALTPAGSGALAEEATIPVERTTSPFDVVDAFEGLAETSGEIDTDQLAASMTTLADLTRNTPEEFRAALSGVSALSEVIASKDAEINSLLQNLDRVSTVLDARDEDILQLMRDSDSLFTALLERKAQIHKLFVSTTTLSRELTGLIRETRADLKPALDQFDTVLKVITKNEDNLENAIKAMAPFYRVFASTLGNGPWFDTFIYNMPPAPGTVKTP